MVDCSKYVCDVHFLLIWLLLIKDYTTNNLIKVWHWIDQIIFVHSLSKFLPNEEGFTGISEKLAWKDRPVLIERYGDLKFFLSKSHKKILWGL